MFYMMEVPLSGPAVERLAEHKMDTLDARYLSGEMSHAVYEVEVAKIRLWVAERTAGVHS
jgi:hypothetical protein